MIRFVNKDYFKGENLNNLEIWNNGEKKYFEYESTPLYNSDGNFVMDYFIQNVIDKVDDVQIKPYSHDIIQIDYKLYLIPIAERLSIQEGRDILTNMLSNYGVSGFNNQRFYIYYDKSKNVMNRPCELSFVKEYRVNTKSFINFNYKDYISEIRKAIIKYPDHRKKIEYLKSENVKIICDYYQVTEKELSRKNFDRLKHAIKILNKKINEASKH